MLTVFCAPLRYVQGAGAMRQLGAEMVNVGLEGPVLLVAGATPISRLATTWALAFDDVGMSHRVRLFGGESSRREIAAIAEEGRSLGARTIVAAGGGKVLDAARSAAAALRLPFVSCPTICSTDAPTSALSVIYADSGPDRGSVEAYEIHRRSPDLVLVDTQVIAESPPRLLAAGIGDAMSTWYEGRAAAAAGRPNMRGGRATLAAVELARLCRDIVLADGAAALEECRVGRVGGSLERVAEAATLLSGLGFESAGLAAAHAVHNGLTAIAATHDALGRVWRKRDSWRRSSCGWACRSRWASWGSGMRPPHPSPTSCTGSRPARRSRARRSTTCPFRSMPGAWRLQSRPPTPSAGLPCRRACRAD
jgi:glycerol dehydrogenase